jgi:hypothetical protein
MDRIYQELVSSGKSEWEKRIHHGGPISQRKTVHGEPKRGERRVPT